MARVVRVSNCLRLKDARTLSAGFNHACRIGLEPNLWVSIHWHWTDYGYEVSVEVALWDFLERLRKWLSRRHVPVVWLYVRERAGGLSSEHAHLLLYCPATMQPALGVMASCWAKSNDPRAIDIRPCWKNRTIRGRDYNARTLAQGYMLKGGDAAVRAQYPLACSSRWSCAQGTIRGKRVGVSAIIGPKAIAAYFRQRRHQPGVDTAGLGDDGGSGISP